MINLNKLNQYRFILSRRLGWSDKIAEKTGELLDTKNNIRKNDNKTAGLVNKVLHQKKTMHQVKDTNKKTEHLFKI